MFFNQMQSKMMRIASIAAPSLLIYPIFGLTYSKLMPQQLRKRDPTRHKSDIYWRDGA